jgi:hypothetical protein
MTSGAARGRNYGRYLNYHGHQDALVLSTTEQRHAPAASANSSRVGAGRECETQGVILLRCVRTVSYHKFNITGYREQSRGLH